MVQSLRGEFARFTEHQHNPEITFSDFVRIYSAYRLHPALQAEDVTDPPAIDNDDAEKVWLVATGAQEAWDSEDGRLAIALGSGWHFRDVVEGMYYNLDTHTWRKFDGTTWSDAGV